MSAYTIGEIAVWLLLTAVLGFVLGWMSRELVLRSRTSPRAESVAQPAREPVRTAEPQPPREPVRATEPDTVTQAFTPGPHAGSALPLAGGAAPTSEHVVKVSRGSTIYHAPTSPAYNRTTAALWFTSAEAAEDAGFRRPKNG